MTKRRALLIHTTGIEPIGDIESRIAFGAPADPALSPFLTLAHHGPQSLPAGNRGLPFDDHPHRGFETVTFILDGALVHSDSGGNRRIVEKGGVQWMTAGKGIIHNEQVPPAFMRDGGSLEILQLWINLPNGLKMTAPTYVGVQADAIPAIPLGEGGGLLHLVAGTHDGVTGPVRSMTNVVLGWIEGAAGGKISLPASRGRTVLFYVVRGQASFDGRIAGTGSLVRFDDGGDTIEPISSPGALFLFGHADPIDEPVAWRGPFVMNSEAEVEQAFRDYRAGGFSNPPTIEEHASRGVQHEAG